jgi:hypothetical protein
VALEGRGQSSQQNVYHRLDGGFLWRGMISRSKHGKAHLFSFNYIVWPELKEFVTSLQEYQVLRLVPREALLIKSYGDSVLFKSIRPQDATPTSFSAYKDSGSSWACGIITTPCPRGSCPYRRSSSTPWTQHESPPRSFFAYYFI